MKAGGAQARRVVLFGALAATLAATAWLGSKTGAPQDFAPAARAALPGPDESQHAPQAPAPEVATTDAQIDLARLKREMTPSGQPADDAFARHTWYVPPPQPRPAPPPRPAAPPLPFTFMGRYAESGRQVVFITNRQDRNYAVAAGDTIEGSYRVDSITERAMTLTYLPLGQQQILALEQ